MTGVYWTVSYTHLYVGGTESLLRNHTLHVHQIYREMETSGKVITVDLVRKLFYGVDEDNKTLLQVFREHNEQSRKLIGKDFVSKTVQRYEKMCIRDRYYRLPFTVRHSMRHGQKHRHGAERVCQRKEGGKTK